MKVYVFNTSIITNPGFYRYIEIPFDVAKELLEMAYTTKNLVSAIGHQGTAEVLSLLTGLEIPMNRIQATMDPGDKAIVFKPKTRILEGTILDKDTVLKMYQEGQFEFGLLERIE